MSMNPLTIWSKKNRWQVVFISTACAAIGFSAYSFFKLECHELNASDFSRFVVTTIHLFLLSVNEGDIKDNYHLVASILAPLSTIGAILLAWGSRISRWFQQTFLFSIKPAQYVFIGGDESAAGLASRFTAIKPNGKVPKIVGLDIQNNRAMRLNKSKGFMLVGDGLNDKDLGNLLLHKTNNIYVTAGNDLLNIEIARRIIKLVKQNTVNNQIKIYVHVRDQHHIRTKEVLVPNEPVVGANKNSIDVQFISIKRMAARAIFHKHPPIIDPKHAPHILIVGVSELAQNLLLHAVQHCVTHETDNVKITWAGEGVSKKYQQLRQQYVGLGNADSAPELKDILPLAQINPIECDADEFRLLQWEDAQQTQAFDMAYIACEKDDHTLSACLRVSTLREITNNNLEIVACFQQSQGSLSQTIKPSDHKTALPLPNNVTINRLYAVNIYNEIIHEEDINYPGEHEDYRAMIVHAAYAEILDFNHIQNQLSDDNIQALAKVIKQEWAEASKVAFNLQSSRLSADHLIVKQQILDYLNIDVAELENNAKAKEILAMIEHRRFIAERLILGWLPLPKNNLGKGVSGLNNKLQKQYLLSNHTLVPFDELHKVEEEEKLDEQREKDRRIVASIPHIERLEQALKALS